MSVGHPCARDHSLVGGKGQLARIRHHLIVPHSSIGATTVVVCPRTPGQRRSLTVAKRHINDGASTAASLGVHV